MRAIYTLRIFAPHPPLWGTKEECDAWISELLEFCAGAGVDRLQFFVNTRFGTYYLPASSAEEQRAWQQWMKTSVVPRVRAAGIAVDLNFQMFLGGTTWGEFDMRDVYQWDFLMDQNGEENLAVADPLCPRFRQEMGAMLALWAGLEPDILWIDDDFRMHNHSIRQPELDFYCFSDRWLEKFSAEQKTVFAREELVQALLAPEAPSSLRGKWQTFVAGQMTETAQWIRTTVKSASPETRLALMVSDPDVHSIEGRHWPALLTALSGEERPLVRPPNGIYTATNRPIKDHACSFRYFAQTMAAVDAEMGKGVVEYAPELENARFTTWAKPVAGSTFCITLAFLLGTPEITMSIFDLEGSPLAEEPSNLPMLRDLKPKLHVLCELDLADSAQKGCCFLVDAKLGEKVQLAAGTKRLDALVPARPWEEVLSTSGIPMRYVTPADSLNMDDVVVLDKHTAWLPSDDELRHLLSKRLFVDAEGVLVLAERGFGAEIGVEVVGGIKPYAAQSEIFNASGFFAGPKRRVPHKGFHWYEIRPNQAKIISELIDCRGTLLPNLCAVETSSGGRLIVSASIGEHAPYAVFGNHTRMDFFRRCLSWLYEGMAEPVMARTPHHSLLVQRNSGEETFLFLANLGADPLPSAEFSWKTGAPQKLEWLNPAGDWTVLAFNYQDATISVKNIHLLPLEWLILRFT